MSYTPSRAVRTWFTGVVVATQLLYVAGPVLADTAAAAPDAPAVVQTTTDTSSSTPSDSTAAPDTSSAAVTTPADTVTTDTSSSTPTVDTAAAPADTSSTSTDAPAVTTDTSSAAGTPTVGDVAATSSDVSATADTTVTTDTTAATPAADTTPAPAPQLSTDKPDYAPTDLVTIFGKFFQSFTSFVLKIVGGFPDGSSQVTHTDTVTSDANGDFSYQYQLDGVYRPNYMVTASDSQGGAILAQTTFTDSSVVMWNQCENNKTGTLGNCGWTSGNLTAAHNSLFEGMATHQEVVITGLGAGTHILRFGVQTTKGGNHAYDWIVSDAQAIQAAAEDGITTTLNPCTGGTGPNNATCASLNSQTGSNHVSPSVPDDAFVSQDGSTQTRITAYEVHFGNRTIDLYSDAAITAVTLTLEGHCGNKTGASCTTVSNGADTGDTYLWYNLTWTSNGTAALMRAAADIALGGDGTGRSWGAGKGATGVSGSPYHFYLNTFDGSGGSLDNQMAAGAVFIPPVTPTVTTHVHNASHVDITNTTVASGTVVHDNATVDTGSASTTIPSGSTFTFHRYTTIDCTGTPTDQTGVAVPSGAQTGTAESATFTPGVGSYSYKADFISGGSSVTNATGICEPFTVISVTPTVNTAIHNASHVVVTSVPAGTTVHDSVTVTGSSGTPTGTVVFSWFTNGTCTAPAAATSSPVTLSSGAADATGFPQGPLAVGSYSFKAHYNGDGTYVAGDGVCEPLAVTKVTPSINTTPSAGGVVGVSVSDNASVTGGFNPTGTVTFNLYGVADATCASAAVFTSTNALSAGSATSGSFATNAVGTYHWIATYNGDSNNNTVTSPCAAETVTTTKASPTISTTPNPASGNVGATLNDTATLSGGFNPTGSVTFKLFPPADATCSGAASYTDVDASAPYATTGGFAANVSGTWHWTADYAGDANNNPASSGCSAEPVTISKVNSTTTTAIHNGSNHSTDVQGTNIALGSTIHDQATVTGSAGTPTGTVTFQYWTNGTCANTVAATSSALALTSGVVDATGFAQGPLGAGDYSFKASYSGDNTYNSSVGACETVHVNKAQLGITTNVHDASHADKTNGSVPLGSIMHDTATVTGGVAGFPVPAVSFTLTSGYTGTCAAGSAVANNGTEGSATKSADSAALGAGAYAYRAQVASDSNYDGATGACEPFTVNKAQLQISTDIHNANHGSVTSVPVGSIVHDTASITGQVGGFTPTGAVTFTFGATCGQGAIATSGSADTGTGGPRSVDTSALAPGSYNFQASVAGDANYLGSTSSCEPLTVNQGTSSVNTELHKADETVVNVNDAVALGTVMHDKAMVTVSDGFAPTGNVTFNFYNNDTCTGTPVSSSPIALNGANPGVAHPSQSSPALQAGAHAFQASWAGDSNYTGSTSECEHFTVSKADTQASTAIHLGSNHTADVQGTSIALNSSIHDKADVTGQVGSIAPTGTLTYKFYSSNNCTGTHADETVALGNESSSHNNLAAGDYSFLTSYSGDSNYNGSTAACETVHVNKANTQLATDIHDATHAVVTSVDLGTTVHDKATLTGQVGSIIPTGNVTFSFYTGNTCEGQGSGAGVVAVDASGIAHPSSSEGPLGAGQYSFKAVYAGDANYNSSTAPCEPLTVNKAQLSVSTIVHDAAHADKTNASVPLGSIMHDTATVTGGVAGFPVPTPTFTLTSNYTETCSQGAAVANNGTEGSAAKSADSAALGAGTYAYRGEVAGNENYLGATGACELFTVNKAQLTVTTNVHNAAHQDITGTSVAVGSVTHDTATVTGGVAGFTVPTPSFTLTSAYSDSCSQGASVANNGTEGSAAKSADSSPLTTGSYAYRASVAGNSNYLGDDSDCEPFGVVNARISIAPQASTNEVGQSHTFTVTVEQDTGSGWTPIQGAIANAVVTPATSLNVSDCNAGTDVNGQCDVVVNSSSAGVFTIIARSTVVVSGVQFKLQTNGQGDNSGPATKTYVDAKISIDQNSTNAVGNSHTFTVTVMKNPGTGWVAAAGETVTPGITGAGSLTGAGTCETGTTDVSGQCTIIVNSATTGVGTVSATTTVTMGGVSVTRALGDNLSGDSAQATKTWVNARISINPPSATNEVGKPHDYTVKVEADNGDGSGFQPVNGAIANAIVSPAASLNVSDCNAGTDVNGECTVTINSSSAGVFTITARSTIIVGGVTFKLQTNGSAPNSGPATKTYVDAKISIAQDATNEVNHAHTFTGHVDVNNGSGWANAADGTTINFSIASGPGSLSAPSCVTAAGSGSCTVDLNSAVAGVTVVNASTSVTVGGVSMSRTTNGLSGNSGPATKTWVDANIQITPGQATNAVNQSHTITATVTKNPGTGSVPANGVTVTFSVTSGTATFVGGVNTCVTNASGQCTVQINAAGTGANTIHATTTFSVGGVSLTRATGDGLSGDSVDAQKTYVDLQILVDQSSTNEVGNPHTFTVTVNSDPGTGTFGPVSGATVTPGITGTGSLTGTGTCQTGTTNASGQCTIIVNSATAGVGTVSASTTVSVGGVSITRALGDGLSGDSAKPTKTWVDAKISITGDSTNEVGHDHTFTVTVKKDLGDGAGLVAAAGETVSSGITGTGSISGGTCTSGTTDVNGQCTIIVHSTSAGTGTVHASTTITVSGVSITRATGDGLSGDSGDTHKTWADASITLSPLTATNAVGQNHVITAHVTKNDGSGVTDAAGVTVNFSITSGSATFVGPSSCVTNASGLCSITITSTSTGSNTVDATTTFSVGGVSLTRATGDGLSGDSAAAQKTYVNARISITPGSATNEVGHQHTFTVTVEQDTGSGFGPVPAGTLANAIVSPTPTSFDASDCTDGVNAAGQCSVTLNSSTAGVFTVTARSQVVVNGVTFKLQTNGTAGNSGPATKTYVDAKIVLSPLTATNNIGSPHTITATVSQNAGSGWVPAPNGTLVTFTLLNNTAGADFIPTSGSNTCTTTGGSCSVQINSSTPGSVDIHATTTFSVGGVSLTRASGDSLSGDSANANKLYVAGALDVTKAVDVSQYPSAGLVNVDQTFTITVTGPSYPSGHNITFTVVDGVLQAPTTIHLSPLIPGTYTVTEANPGIAWSVSGSGGVTVVANQTASKTITNALKKPHTTISITSNPQEVAPGENVTLTITDTNDGQVPLTNPSVVLTYGAHTETMTKTSSTPAGICAYQSGDTNGNGIMDVGETWTWTCTVVISTDTTFNVAGHGTDSFGTDITPANGVTSEAGSITVKIIARRMTGGGSIFTAKTGTDLPLGGVRVTHGFELHCDLTQNPNNLEINWNDKTGNAQRFHLDSLTSVTCTKTGNPAPPKSTANGFNTYTATGVGSYNGVPGATISFVFTDFGEPGTKDTASYEIKVGSTVVLRVSAKNLDKGNHQAH